MPSLKIAILGGTGALGAGLAVRLSKAGHQVLIGSRSPEKAAAFVADMKAKDPGFGAWGGGLAEAAAKADLSFLTVPYAAHAETLAQVRPELAGKLLVDATAPLRPPKVGTVQLPEAGSAAVEAQRALGPEVRVASALQTVSASCLAGAEAIDEDVLVAADGAADAELVCQLMAEIGLRAWHVGPLANSAAAEAMTSVLIQINRRYKRAESGVRITGKPRPTADASPDERPRQSDGVSIWPLQGLPLFCDGDDLAAALGDSLIGSGLALQEGDIIVVAQKVVSKVEGRAVRLDQVTPAHDNREIADTTGKSEPLIELIRAESSELMRVRSGLLITRHRTGHVTANAGIDFSNVVDPSEPETALLWPADPDASAARLRAALRERFGVNLAVIISDSLGRAWRVGTAGTAIGTAGLRPLRDRRGETDLFGRVLQATVVAVADEVASAASLVIGEAAERTPAALVRGVVFDADDAVGVTELLRPIEQDLFR